MSNIAIVATHPIQYYAPLYRALMQFSELGFKVFFGERPNSERQGVQFNRPFQWDVDLLSGYPHLTGPEAELELRRGIEERRWDAIFVHGWHHSFYRRAIAHAWKRKVPVLVRGDSHLHTPRSAWKRLVKYPLYRMLLPRFAGCLAVGTWNAEYYRHYGVPPEKIFHSPHCVDNAWFESKASALRAERARFRAQWGLDQKSFVFLFVGRMASTKRVEDFLRAISAQTCSHPQVQGLLVGDGPLLEHYREVARTLEAPVTFAGFLNQTEVIQAYVVSDALVLPSSGEETWGLVANEAMACGLPCILSDQVGCAVDMIADGVNGCVYPCGDWKALSKSMAGIASQKIRCDPGGVRWVQVLQKHSCQTAASGIRDALGHILQ